MSWKMFKKAIIVLPTRIHNFVVHQQKQILPTKKTYLHCARTKLPQMVFAQKIPSTSKPETGCWLVGANLAALLPQRDTKEMTECLELEVRFKLQALLKETRHATTPLTKWGLKWNPNKYALASLALNIPRRQSCHEQHFQFRLKRIRKTVGLLQLFAKLHSKLSDSLKEVECKKYNLHSLDRWIKVSRCFMLWHCDPHESSRPELKQASRLLANFCVKTTWPNFHPFAAYSLLQKYPFAARFVFHMYPW